ncbi:FAD-dependent oxidoreductase [Candidatus Bathyarchaeota archaeon]|nr:FAD-dependent oxidoreductase [Candidatus Bathyarchaeota archaeon]
MASKLKYPNLFKPIWIGDIEVKNRIVHVPTDISSSNADGSINERVIHYHEELAKAGVGLIEVGATTPDSKTGRPTVTCIVADGDNYIPGLHRLARAMQRYGARCTVQIQHPGRQAAMPRYEQVSCSDIVTVQPASAGHEVVYATAEAKGKAARAMSIEEIYDLIDKFSEAAWRVQQAGFDGVTLHAAHGYLIAQFMSEYTNRRIDRFGGSFENRMRFPLEIIRDIQRKCGPDFPILFRYSADEFVPGGRTLEESVKVAKVLESAGVAALDISAGTFDTPGPVMDPMYYPEGWCVYMAETIKKAVSIPVITSHSLRDPGFCDRIIAEGKADMVGFSRQFIADPYWTMKAYHGKPEEIRKCISCLVGCWQESLMIKHELKCAINPAVGDERFWDIGKASRKLSIAIVGGGPSGMEAARFAVMRGHKPVIFEREGELGGALKYCCMVPHKITKMRWYMDWIRNQIKRLNVEVHLRTEPSAGELGGYDLVLVGTGGESLRPDIPGADKAVRFEEVLRCNFFNCPWHPGDRPGPVEVGERVLVWGDHFAGANTAEALALAGKDVTVVTENREFATNLEPVHRDVMMKLFSGVNPEGLSGKVPRIPVKIYTGSTVYSISNGKAVVQDGRFIRREVPADTVVLAHVKPSNSLYKELVEDGVKAVLMGDAVKVRNLLHATREGAHYALEADADTVINANLKPCRNLPMEVQWALFGERP